MNWPPNSICKRILKLWALAYGSSHSGESANALAALRRLQGEFGLNDVELNFIAEFQQKEPIGSSIGADEIAKRPVNPLELLLHLIDASHIVLTFEQMIVVALWTIATHVFDLFLHTARLLLRSSEPGCGKTTLMSLMDLLVNNGFMTSNTSPAVLYHQLLKRPRTTFLIDELEHSSLWMRDPILLSIFDAGHRRGGSVTRVIRGEVIKFSVFAPLALAAVPKKRFAPQLLSRAIIIDIENNSEGKDEVVPHDPRFATARSVISEFAGTFKRPETCKIPLVGRPGDNWRPLIEVGEALGYGATARAAALAIHRPGDDPVIRLLFDIRRLLEGVDRIWTPELLDALHRLENANWDEFTGIDENQDPHKLTRSELYRFLRTKGIRSQTVWKAQGGERKSNKGFYVHQFEPLWRSLFGDTQAQASKLNRLPLHKRRHMADTD